MPTCGVLASRRLGVRVGYNNVMAALKGNQRKIATAWAAPYRFTLVSGPQGCGKTHAGLINLLLGMRNFGDCDFGILTKTRKQLKSSLRGGIEQILGEELDGDDEVLKVPNGYGATNNLISLWPTTRLLKRGCDLSICLGC